MLDRVRLCLFAFCGGLLPGQSGKLFGNEIAGVT
jgi:hypothetical protein